MSTKSASLITYTESVSQTNHLWKPTFAKTMVSINRNGFPLNGYGFPLHGNGFPLQGSFEQIKQQKQSLFY